MWIYLRTDKPNHYLNQDNYHAQELPQNCGAPFLTGAGLTLVIAALTVCYQSLSAARTQPVEALTHE